MRIQNLSVTNFRGIRSAVLSDLQTLVVIAGQNGSGKSCLLDAIRLVKSVYGGYQANEWHHWMGEFQINFTNKDDLDTLRNDRTKELRITCEFAIHSEEREYLRQHCEELIHQSVWRTIYPELYGWSNFKTVSLAAHLRGREAEIKHLVSNQVELMNTELSQEKIIGEFSINPNQGPEVRQSKVLEIIFGTFRPNFLGVLDYHGPHRTYGREILQGINLNLDAIEQQRSAHALYNYANKYANVKSEMASSYIKEIIATEAVGTKSGGQDSLSTTLKELFRTFFPDKEFLGPQPTSSGSLIFPVRTGDGSTHDLNELSAGEKELLYGYLRLRNSAPRYSVILLDEPELHLNPRLIKELPGFYQKHLGEALDNQIWLITHSDALLREAVGREGCSVFHMQAATTNSKKQLIPLIAKEGLQKAVIDLVGDLAAYRPDAKIIIFEGENSEFDQRMSTLLFPVLLEKANTVSAGNKQRVKGLHDILSVALEKGQIPIKIFSIMDADADSDSKNPMPDQSFVWDVYHIENFLLETNFILKICKDLGISTYSSEEDIYMALRDCARETMTGLIRHKLGQSVRAELLKCIRTATDPNKDAVGPDLAKAVSQSATRLVTLVNDKYTLEKLVHLESVIAGDYQTALAADSWRKRFRGRDILRCFVGRLQKGDYEIFRDLIIANMRDAGFKPEGMRVVIDTILNT